jgi:hypothetical protein
MPVGTPAPASVPAEEVKNVETPVKKEPEPETVDHRDSSPRVIRRIRRISRAPEHPVRKRIVRRRRPVERNEEEIEEIIEYIDEEPGSEDDGEVYDEYEDDDDYEDEYEENVDYLEKRPRRPQPRIERHLPINQRRERPSAYEERPAPSPVIKKPSVSYRPAPSMKEPEKYPEVDSEFEEDETSKTGFTMTKKNRLMMRIPALRIKRLNWKMRKTKTRIPGTMMRLMKENWKPERNPRKCLLLFLNPHWC